MSLNPWVALILGVLIGWLLQWVLELWFFRRRRLECQQRLSRVETDLQARDAELRNARAHADSLEADLTALRAGPAAADSVSVASEQLSSRLAGPEVDVALSDVDLPSVEIEAPEVDIDLPEVEAPAVDFDALQGKVAGGVAAAGGLVAGALGKLGGKVELPEAEIEAPEVDIDLPEVEAPAVDFDALQGKVAGGVAAAGGLVAGASGKLGGKADIPEGELELPEVEAELPAIDFDRLNTRVELPDVELPSAEIEAPEVDVELPKAEVDWPALSAELDGVAVDAPALNISAPSIAADLPMVEAGLPEAAVEALMPDVKVELAADDLTRVPGVGPKYAEQLAASGITTYVALSAAQPDQLKAIVNAPDWRRVDYDAWIAGASALAAGPRLDGAADDLTLVEGIGPVYAAKLSAAGITTFAELAAADEAGLSAIIQTPAWRRTNYSEWIAQARLAAVGDQEGLKALQDTLFNRVRRKSQEA